MKSRNTQSARFTNTGCTNVTTAHSNWTCADPSLGKVVHIKQGMLNGKSTITIKRLSHKHGSEHVERKFVVKLNLSNELMFMLKKFNNVNSFSLDHHFMSFKGLSLRILKYIS